jgi:Fe-S cluster assembly ATP-binding protein
MEDTGLLLITHTTRLLKQIPAQFVHVFGGGVIVTSGGPELAERIDAEGYEAFAAVPAVGK